MSYALDVSIDPPAHLITNSSEKILEVLPDIESRITLAVTSPPYHNAISYESHVQNPLANYRERENVNYASEYMELLDRVWRQVYLTLKPGGYFAINVGTVLDKGYQYPLPQDIVARLQSAQEPWEFVRTIFWNKVTAGVKRAGTVIKHQLPGYWYPNIMTEHIIVIRRPGPLLPVNQSVPKEWFENIWDLAPTPPRTIEHPAPFPEDLPHRLIRMLTQPGDLVLDPFNGSGTTTKAAFQLGRESIGFDLSPVYTEYAKKRLHEPSRVREQQLFVVPINSSEFNPGRSRGTTRHGSGKQSK
jgi:DNA modification methylase